MPMQSPSGQTSNCTNGNQWLKAHCVIGSAVTAILQVCDGLSACAAESLCSHGMYRNADTMCQEFTVTF